MDAVTQPGGGRVGLEREADREQEESLQSRVVIRNSRRVLVLRYGICRCTLEGLGSYSVSICQ